MDCFINQPLSVFSELISSSREFKTLSPTQIHQRFVAYFNSTFNSSADLTLIPSLNELKRVDSIKSNSLVRFRCFVQDIFDPEIYFAKYQIIDANGVNREKIGILNFRTLN